MVTLFLFCSFLALYKDGVCLKYSEIFLKNIFLQNALVQKNAKRNARSKATRSETMLQNIPLKGTMSFIPQDVSSLCLESMNSIAFTYGLEDAKGHHILSFWNTDRRFVCTSTRECLDPEHKMLNRYCNNFV